MRSLIIKIFLAYWFAAGLVIIISNMQPHTRIHNPELYDALDGALSTNASYLIKSYSSGNCAAALANLNSARDQVALATEDGKILCGNITAGGLKALAVSAAKDKKRTTRSYSTFQITAYPTALHSRDHYIILLLNNYKSPLQFYGNLPGNTTIIISGVVTLFLALLVAVPIKRLRNATYQISIGNLETRVQRGFISRYLPFIKGGDDLDALASDFNDMAARIQRLVDAQRLLLRDVSHELRSPLARVSLAVELARSESPSGAQGHLDRIELETRRLNDLISQLMDLSYMNSIHEFAPTDHIDLHQLLIELLPDMQFEANAKKCQIDSTQLDTIPAGKCLMTGDLKLLQHAVENVVRNAITFSPENGIITVDLHIDEHEGRQIATLSVSDCGPGVPDEQLQTVLNPFYRVDNSRQSSSGGFGIGLAIVDRAISLHHGTIKITNRTQGGLSVQMNIPINRND